MNQTVKLVIEGDLPPKFRQAFALLKEELGFEEAEDGFLVSVKKSHCGLRIEKDLEKAMIYWQKPVQFYRALSLLRQEWEKENYSKEETPCFEVLGMMFDVSRNAVLKVDSLKSMFRKMALMGIELGMMYTEDTYEIPQQPYFGWMRGRYSMQEIMELDDYASLLGIELCPCIQTLGHLNRALHWPALAHLKDNEEVLLEGLEETYVFLEQAIDAAVRPYRSKRIHIGMDEAHGIGLGEHLRRFGYENPHVIIKRHLMRIKEIIDKKGLSAMMWSDMYFRPDSPTAGYYDSGEPSCESIEAVPDDIMLLYWDYYHEDRDIYVDMLRKHRILSDQVGFVSGIWTWTGPAPSYDKTFATVLPGLQAAKEGKVPFVMATAWGDNGAETNLQTALLGMQLFAEFNYTGRYEEEELGKRFAACCKGDMRAFAELSDFNTVPGMKSSSLRPVNAAKFLLYQDPLVQIYEEDTKGLPMAAHYLELSERYEKYEKVSSEEYTRLFGFYKELALVLEGKCRWHEKIGQTVRLDDKKTAIKMANDLGDVEAKAQNLRRRWGELWNETNKPFGFEILDGRMGAVCARLDTARMRIMRWAKGQEEAPAELLEPLLPYTRLEDGALFGSYAVGEIVSASKIDI